MTSNSLVTDTPLGRLVLTESNGYLTECRFTDDGPLSADSVATKASPVLRATVAQLNDYFCGQRRNFELPLAPAGTDFQRRVWALLQTIPYGETRSYQQLAR